MAWIQVDFPQLRTPFNEITAMIESNLIDMDICKPHLTFIYDCGHDINAISEKFRNLPPMKMKIIDIRAGHVSPVLLLEFECEELETLFWTFYEDDKTNGDKNHTLIKGKGTKQIDGKGYAMHITICWLKDFDCFSDPSIKNLMDKKIELLKKFDQYINIDEFTWFSMDWIDKKIFNLRNGFIENKL